eukprot:g7293.t1
MRIALSTSLQWDRVKWQHAHEPGVVEFVRTNRDGIGSVFLWTSVFAGTHLLHEAGATATFPDRDSVPDMAPVRDLFTATAGLQPRALYPCECMEDCRLVRKFSAETFVRVHFTNGFAGAPGPGHSSYDAHPDGAEEHPSAARKV